MSRLRLKKYLIKGGILPQEYDKIIMKRPGSNPVNLKDFVNTNIKTNPNTNITVKLVNTETNEKIFIGSSNKNTTTYYTVIYDPQHTSASAGNAYYCNRIKDVAEVINFLFENEDIYATKIQSLNSNNVLDQSDTISLDDKRYEYLYNRELIIDPDEDIYND